LTSPIFERQITSRSLIQSTRELALSLFMGLQRSMPTIIGIAGRNSGQH